MKSVTVLTSAAVVAACLAPAARGADGRRFAVVVGVSEYQASDALPVLPGAANDAAALRKALVNGGYRDADVVLLGTRGQTAGRPTGANVLAALARTFAQAGPDDTVVVAMSGHGLQFKDAAEQFFCPADADPGKRDTLIPLTRVFADLGRCRAGRKVMLVDACRNDPREEDKDATADARLADGFAKLDLPAAGNFVALFSCAGGQKSLETGAGDDRHGVFFRHVILGLNGDAETGNDGAVGQHELALYVTSGVKKYVERHFSDGVSQTPTLRTVGEVTDFPLVVPAKLGQVDNLMREADRAEKKGDLEAAAEAYARVIELDRKKADAYLERGKLLAKLGKAADAREDFRKAVYYNRDLVPAYLKRSDLFFADKNYVAALDEYKNALEAEGATDEDKGMVHTDRGYVYAELGETDKALADYERAIKLYPSYPHAYYYRAMLRKKLGQADVARADLDHALSLDPAHPTFRAFSARLAADVGDDARVQKEEKRIEAIAKYTPVTDVGAQETLYNQRQFVGHYYEQTGRSDRAEQAYERAGRGAERVAERGQNWLNDAKNVRPDSGDRTPAQQRQYDRAQQEANRMGGIKQKAIEQRMEMLDEARRNGQSLKAKGLENQLKGLLPPNMRKEYELEQRQRAQEERQGGGQRPLGLFGQPKPLTVAERRQEQMDRQQEQPERPRLFPTRQPQQETQPPPRLFPTRQPAPSSGSSGSNSSGTNRPFRSGSR